MSYQYSYLIGDGVLVVIWLILFLLRKDVRKEMWIISFIFGCAGIISQFVYSLDWWHPLTITNTVVGIEDFIFGFVVGGIASVIYEEVFKKRIRKRKVGKNKNNNLSLVTILLAILFLVCFFLLKMNSVYSSVIAFLIPTLYIWIKRKDLIVDSVVSGFLLMVVSFSSFIVVELVTPGWVGSAWYLDRLSEIRFLTVPLKDIIWFFFAGAFIGPLYEFWKERKLTKK